MKGDKPYPHQRSGAEFLCKNKRAVLADEAGLGKSRQVIMAMDALRLKSAFIVCPANACINWQREFEMYSTRGIVPTIAPESSPFMISSYQKTWMYKECWRDAKFEVVVIDEAHYLKDLETTQTQCILGRQGLVHTSPRTWSLSATLPVNHYGELWPIMFTMGWATLAYDAFIKRFCKTRPSPWGRQIVGSNTDRAAELKLMLGTNTLRRTEKQAGIKLPPIRFSQLLIEPSDEALKIYIPDMFRNVDNDFMKQVRQETLALQKELDENRTADELAAINSVPTPSMRRHNGLQKAPNCAKIISDELSSGSYDKIIIFAWHTWVIDFMHLQLINFNPVRLDGTATPDTKSKQAAADKFQNDKSCRVFIGNMKAAGISINLTAAKEVFFAEYDYVPGNNKQAWRRALRIGQKRSVNVRFASIPHSIDDRITQIAVRKSREIEELYK